MGEIYHNMVKRIRNSKEEMNILLFTLKQLLENPQNDDAVLAAKRFVEELTDHGQLHMFGGNIYGSLKELAPFLVVINCVAIAYENESTRSIITVVCWDPENLCLVERQNNKVHKLDGSCDLMFKLEFGV